MSHPSERAGVGPHVGDLAELYALGALDPEQRADVETHVAQCAACSRALGAAESTVAALDAAFVPRQKPPDRLGHRIAASARAALTPTPLRTAQHAARPVASWYATAAALVLAAGVGAGALAEHTADARQAARDSTILATLATSHFNHTTFTPLVARVPVSKVLYARDGGWFYVVIDGARCGCRVVAHSAAGMRDLGSPAARGATATLFAQDAARPRFIELIDAANTVMAKATLIYPRS
jgi:hypothetical protein